MKKPIENIALFDMDGTLCDYDSALERDLEMLRSIYEPILNPPFHNLPDYLKNRADLIRRSEKWWENLPKLKLGWDVLELAKTLNYRITILTQAPRENPAGGSGKMKWLMKNIPNVNFTITRDKGLVYGKLLVDDWPDYIERWLECRPRGLVIMPAHEYNADYKNPNVIRYDGTNLSQVKSALKKARNC